MTDEEVIKRRLIIDGDGTGDERRLNSLHKSLHKICTSNDDLKESFDRMIGQLTQCEFAVKKSRKVATMNTIELQNYQNLARKITQDIEAEKEKIEKTKLELVDAQRIRKNKMEYDALGKVIASQPDRKRSEEKLSTLQTELSSLRKSRGILLRRLSSRKRQFHGLVLMLHQLEATINEGDEEPTPPVTEDSSEDQGMELDASPDDIIVV